MATITATQTTSPSSLSRSSSTSTIRPPSRASTSSRPSTPKRAHSHSSSWYFPDENPSLEDIARSLETLPKRLERFQGLCATNVVMALFSPTPALLFLFHPLLWILLLGLGMGYLGLRGAS